MSCVGPVGKMGSRTGGGIYFNRGQSDLAGPKIDPSKFYKGRRYRGSGSPQ